MTKILGYVLMAPMLAIVFAYFVFMYKQVGRKAFINIMLGLAGFLIIWFAFLQGAQMVILK